MGIVFIGSQQIGHDCLLEILKMKIKVDAIFTFNPDKHEKWNKSVDIISEKEKIPLFFPNELTVEKIREINPELIIVAGYRKIFSKEILDVPKHGIIGLHASLLPHLRGLAPLNWAIINGDKKTGITMFFMNKEIDKGDIIAQKETEIKINDTIVELKEKICKLAVELINENLKDILAGKANRVKQPEQGTYGKKRTPEDGLIDWKKSNLQIYNLIRALEPSYPAFTYIDSRKLFIKKAQIDKKNTLDGTPGQVVKIYENGGVDVVTGDGLISLVRVNFEDESEVHASLILKSNSFVLG